MTEKLVAMEGGQHMSKKNKNEVIIPNTPFLRQKYAALFCGVSLPTFLSMEKVGIVKRHEIRNENVSSKPIPFYVKDELEKAMRSL
jgi:hypothetical protein